MKVQGRSTGDGFVRLSGKSGFTVAGQEVKGKASGQGDVALVCGSGLEVTHARFGLEISGLLKKAAGILDVVPGLRALENVPVIGRLARWFNRRARVVATLEPNVDLTADFRSTDEGWKWVGATGGARLRMTLALILRVLKRGMSVAVWGGGEPAIQFQVPPDPSYLKSASATLFAGVRIRVWRLQRTLTKSYRWVYTPRWDRNSQMAELSTQHAFDSGWAPIPRDYSKPSLGYAVFRGNNVPFHLGTSLASARRTGRINTTEENLIVSNVFPESYPAVAADDRLLLLWVHDDVNKPIMQGEEIYYSVFDGTRWTQPSAITDDNLQDFSPQVVFYAPNRALAVWERNKMVQSQETELNAAYSNGFEIAYAVWDGNTWSKPTYLTDNNVLDHTPVLIQGEGGLPMLVWRQNPGGVLVGDAENPDTFYYSFWTGEGWSPPRVLLAAISGVLDITGARYRDSRLAVVFSRDTDGDLGTDSDQELYVMGWKDGEWVGPFQITHDELPDNRPTLFYNDKGFPRLFWLKDDALYGMIDSLTGAGHRITVEESASILDYVAVRNHTGDIVLLWQGYSPEGVDVFYASYDEMARAFNLVEQLTHDLPVETFISADFTHDGELIMAFDRTEILTSTVSVSPTLAISNVATFGQTDLYVLRHTFGADLALVDGDILVDPTNPEPGSPVQLKAVLRNIGDKSVIKPSVAFYLGDPDAGGRLIATATADMVLTGGMTTTVGVVWNVPSTGAPFQISVVADPDNEVDEIDETNNKANTFVSLPDLTMGEVRFTYSSGPLLFFTTTVTNTGVIPSPPNTVVFRVGSPITGTIVATSTLGTLGLGEAQEVEATWDTRGVQGATYDVYAVVDPRGVIPEAREDNNVGTTNVVVLPDLALVPSGIRVSPGDSGGTTIGVWVFNTGPADAYDVKVRVYDRDPGSGASPIASGTLSWIPSGDERLVNIDLGSYQWGFYVEVEGKPSDLDTGDNLLLVGPLPRFSYIPLVEK